jgi:hypothetical protein
VRIEILLERAHTQGLTRQYLGMLPVVLAGDGLTCVRSGVSEVDMVWLIESQEYKL